MGAEVLEVEGIEDIFELVLDVGQDADAFLGDRILIIRCSTQVQLEFEVVSYFNTIHAYNLFRGTYL